MTNFDITSTWRDELDSQQCITLSSHISKTLHSSRRKTKHLNSEKKYYPEETSPVCYILSWLALCCATEPNQIVSLALSAVTPGALTIYLSSNIDHAPRTIECLHAFFSIISHLCNVYPSIEDIKTHSPSLQRTIVEYAWPHFQQKWRRLSEFETGLKLPDGSPEPLESLFLRSVDDWVKWCTRTDRSTNRSKDLAFFISHMEIDPERHDIALKILLEKLLLPLDGATTPEDKLAEFKDRSSLAYILLKSDYFAQLRGWVSPYEVDVFERFRRKLFRLAMFKRGAEALVNKGIPFFRDIAWGGSPNRHWTIHWVPRQTAASDFKLSSPPRDHAKELLDTFGFPQEDIREAEKRTFEDAWSVGQSLTLRVHSPVSLAVYLASREVPVLQDTLGMSKPPCTACASFIAGLRPTWCTTGSMDKCSVDWLIPQDTQGIEMDDVRRGIHLASQSCSDNIIRLFKKVAAQRRIQTIMAQY